MKEEYLHYAFKKRMWGNTFITTKQETLKILEFGEHNQNAGPDFIDTQIYYDGKIWVGAIEFHINGSDWFNHGHQNDPAYGNVTVHFVVNDDVEVKINNVSLPVVVLKNRIDLDHYKEYIKLVRSKESLPCQHSLQEIPPQVVMEQKQMSLRERLWKKSLIVVRDIESSNGDRKKAFFLALARVMGGKVNQLPFEGLMERIDPRWFAKMNYDSIRAEALVLGLSGLLPASSKDTYIKKLIKEFKFQCILFNLTSGKKIAFKYATMRPSNFPDIRLAQFAALLNKNWHLDLFFQTSSNLRDIKREFKCGLHAFWKTHYRLKQPAKTQKQNGLSNEMIELIIINAVVPYIYGIGLLEGNDEFNEKAVALLKEINAEKNTIIRNWKNAGIEVKTAFDSQSLLELKKHSCNRKKCLFCAIGKQILKR